MMPERFTSIDIAQVHLYRRTCYRSQSIAQRNRVMSQRARVNDDAISALCVLLDIIYQRALVVGLKAEHCCAQLCCMLMQLVMNLIQRYSAINRGFGGAKSI